MSGRRAKRERQEEAKREQAAASERVRAEQLKVPLNVSDATPQELSAPQMRTYEHSAEVLGKSAEELIELDRAAAAAEAATISEARRAHEQRLRQRGENARLRREQRAAATHRQKREQGQKRERVVTIRMSDDEYVRLNAKASQLQVSLSAYLVQSGLGRRIRRPKR